MPGKKKGGKIGMKRNRNKKTLTEVKYKTSIRLKLCPLRTDRKVEINL
jgi:hypothetical protein